MLGGAYHWHPARFTEDARAERARAAAERRAHRATPKRERASKDLLEVLNKLKSLSRMTPRQVLKYGPGKFRSNADRWVRQYHRLRRYLDNL